MIFAGLLVAAALVGGIFLVRRRREEDLDPSLSPCPYCGRPTHFGPRPADAPESAHLRCRHCHRIIG